MGDEPQSYMFDSVAFNRAADGKITPSSSAAHRLFATEIQLAELRATRDQQRRSLLISVFEELQPSLVLASSFAFGIEGAGFGQAFWNDGTGSFERMLARLRGLDVAKRRKKSAHNQIRDVLIAETAIKNDAILVTDDLNLRQMTIEFGGSSITCEQFNHLP